MDRLRHFARAAKFGSDMIHEDEVVATVTRALAAADLPQNDEQLLKLAVTTIAYLRELHRIVSGHSTLDHYEQAILEATLSYLRKREKPS